MKEIDIFANLAMGLRTLTLRLEADLKQLKAHRDREIEVTNDNNVKVEMKIPVEEPGRGYSREQKAIDDAKLDKFSVKYKPVDPRKAITIDDIRGLFRSKMQEGKTNFLKTLLDTVGAKDISSIPEAEYNDFYDKMLEI